MQKKKILLIDDNNDTLDLLEIFLYKTFNIITASNGFEGLKIAEIDMPNCIMTDIMMPMMDGIKFFNNLKKNGKIANIPVIAVTSFIKKTNANSLINIGFSSIIVKPFTREIVIESIMKVLQSQSTHEK